MATYTKQQLVEIAERLGHTDLWMMPSGPHSSRWAIGCSCGWGAPQPNGGARFSVTRATQAEAVAALQHHLWKVVTEEIKLRRSTGVSLSDLVGPKL